MTTVMEALRSIDLARGYVIFDTPSKTKAREIIHCKGQAYQQLAYCLNQRFALVRFPGGEYCLPSRNFEETTFMNEVSSTADPKMNIAEAVLFTNFDPKVWNRDWVKLLEAMAECDRPQVLIRVSDQRQLWCNQLFADVMRSSGNEIVQRSVKDFWRHEDLERLNQELVTSNSFEISYSARLNDAGLWGALRAHNNVYELGGVRYRLSTNLECQLIQQPVFH